MDKSGSDVGDSGVVLLLKRLRSPCKALRGIQIPTWSSPGLRVVCGLVAAKKMLSGFKSPMNLSPFPPSFSSSLSPWSPTSPRSDAKVALGTVKFSKLEEELTRRLDPGSERWVDERVGALVAEVIFTAVGESFAAGS